ncbi:MAG TPA: divalent metal cation transporter [Bacillota bacterium]|nr:divalent metal cation transporter [Bacillota bacterium]
MPTSKLSKWWKKVLLFLAVIGPGIITANVDNDPGGITTYSLAGAHYGYMLLWTLIPITVALIIVQEICARMGAVTGKGLADLIRENFGLRSTFFMMAGLLFTNWANTVTEFAGVAAGAEILGVSKYISVPLAAIFVWWLVVKGSYRRVEKVFLGASLFYITYIISGFLAHPRWGDVFTQMIHPVGLTWNNATMFMVIGMVGTTIAPWMQFYLQASIVEKGVTVKEYRISRWDVIVGCFVATIVAFFIVAACGATMFPRQIHIVDAHQAAQALGPLAGRYARWLFAFGLLNAGIFAASILPLSTAYFICEGMGWESGVNKDWTEAPAFFTLYTALILFGSMVVLIPKISLVWLMVISQVLNGILLPIVLIYMLILANDKRLMGEYTNTPIFNWIAWITTVLMSGLSIALLVSALFPRIFS